MSPNTIRRTLQFGFVKFMDDTGGNLTKKWFDFHRSHYAFKRPMRYMPPDAESGFAATGDTDIQVGRASGGGRRPNTFRLMPLGVPPGQHKEEYVKKMLFSWALFAQGDYTAALFPSKRTGQGQLPEYEHSRKEGGPGPRATPLSPHQQKKKFLWSRLQHQRREILLNATNFTKIYSDSILGVYKMRMNIEANKGIRELMKKIDVNMTVHNDERTSLQATSEEELLLAIAPELAKESQLPTSSAEMIARMRKVAGDTFIRRGSEGETRGESMIDLPPTLKTELAAVGKYIEKYGGSDTLIEDIKRGGLEVTEQYRRLNKIYGAVSGDITDYMEEHKKNIQNDIFSKATTGQSKFSEKAQSKGITTVAEQIFSPKRLGKGGSGTLTWSEPTGEGVAFFSVTVPDQIKTKDSIGVNAVHIRGPKYVWEGVLNALGVEENHSDIRNSIASIYKGVIQDTEGNIIKTKTLANAMVNVGVGRRFTTRVDATLEEGVAGDLYNLVASAAENFSDRLTVADNSNFTGWLAAQHKRGEEAALSIHNASSKNWKGWLNTVISKADGSGPYNLENPSPLAGGSYPQPVHPRPFLWLTGIGQAPGSERPNAERELKGAVDSEGRRIGGRFK